MKLFVGMGMMIALWCETLSAKEEVVVIQELIERSERQLATQKHLKELMISLEKQEDLFMNNKTSAPQILFMTETAHKILELIEHNHYEQLFPPIYLEELKLFTHIAKKHNPQLKYQ